MPKKPRSVLVTGGASGIGRAVVQAFMATGDLVASLDVVKSGVATWDVVGDVRDPKAHKAAVAQLLGNAGHIDVLIANAGVHDGGLDLSVPAEELLEKARIVYDVNVLGSVLALQATAGPLRASGGAVVLTLSDASYLEGQTGAGVAYTASKHALVGVLRWAARRLAPEVRVNGVAPGGVITGLRVAASDESSGRAIFDEPTTKRTLVASRNLLGTMLEPEEVAPLYLFLTSDLTRGMTGEVLRPDGGLSLR